jgi:hypothetical protein
MKFFITTTLLFAQFFAFHVAAQELQCGTDMKMQEQLAADAELRAVREGIEEFTQRWIEDEQEQAERVVYTIPVVVHVVYKTAAQNITDEQIFSQIDVLNEDYRANNADVSGVPAVWTDRVADCEIQFALAERTPNGFETNGITRTETDVSSWNGSDDVKFTSLGGHDAWPAADYLNIWVCNIGSGLLGYTYQPGINPALDGVVIGYRYFGREGNISSTYYLGRTATHEIGHYFNLNHLWGSGGDNSSCTANDGVSDTPKQQGPNYGCNNTYPLESCGTGVNSDMFNNYMDYGNDECLFFFTNGQKSRMLATLNGPRSGLKTSNGLTPPVVGIEEQPLASSLIVYPNPSTGTVNLRLDQADNALTDVQVMDMSGRVVFQESNIRLGYANYSLDLNELTAGVYVLELTSTKERISRKIHIID